MSEYDDWGLELLRKECADREIVINTKDGVKTLAARLRASDKAVEKVQTEDETVELETDIGVFEREDKAFEVELERDRYQFYVAKQRVPKPIKVREMRENEDIDDYFRIFEMTAKAQLISQDEWLGSLIPRLSEKAKSIYLEIVGPDAQDYNKSKAIILRAYQLNVDHYRYRFRHSEKKAGEILASGLTEPVDT